MGDERDRSAPGHEGQTPQWGLHNAAVYALPDGPALFLRIMVSSASMLAGCPFCRGGLYLEDPVDIDENPIDIDIATPLDPLNPWTFSAAKKRVIRQLVERFFKMMVGLARENIDAQSTRGMDICKKTIAHFVSERLSPKAPGHVQVETAKAVATCFAMLLRLVGWRGR